MERKAFMAIATSILLLSTFVHQVAAPFPSCFAPCVIDCLLEGGMNVAPCMVNCFTKCIVQLPISAMHYCKLGCSLDKCAKFTNDVKGMEGCVDNCDKQTCTSI